MVKKKTKGSKSIAKKATGKKATKKAPKKKLAMKKPAKRKPAKVSRPKAKVAKKGGVKKPAPVAVKKKPQPKPKAAPPPAPPPVYVPAPNETAVGKVTHYYSHLQVAVVHLDRGALQVGDTIHIKGHTTDFQQVVESMEIEHQHIERAESGDIFGLKVIDHAREHDVVYRVQI